MKLRDQEPVEAPGATSETAGESGGRRSRLPPVYPKTLRFVACVDGDSGIPVAICLEHDLVAQSAGSIDGIRPACEEMLLATIAMDREEGLGPWERKPPPDDAVAEFRATPGAFEFAITYDPKKRIMHLIERYGSARVQEELAGARDASMKTVGRYYAQGKQAWEAIGAEIDQLLLTTTRPTQED